MDFSRLGTVCLYAWIKVTAENWDIRVTLYVLEFLAQLENKFKIRQNRWFFGKRLVLYIHLISGN